MVKNYKRSTPIGAVMKMEQTSWTSRHIFKLWIFSMNVVDANIWIFV